MVESEEALKQRLDPHELPTGAIVGAVEIYDCIRKSKSKWAERSSWHWLLRNPRVLAKPIPFKGSLGLMRVPDELLKSATVRAL